MQLLKNLPPVWGVNTVDFADYVQPLPQKVALRDEEGKRIPGQYRKEYRLYMSVAGREKMIQTAAEDHDWRVDFEASDYIVLDKVAPIYRETCVIFERYGCVEDGTFREVCLGRKSGTAKFGGGDFPVEKAETAARGRSIAAWGFGVLPGSGVASLEEMEVSPGRESSQEPTSRQKGAQETPEQVLEEVLLLAEEARQLRGISEPERDEKLADYIKKASGVEIAVDLDENGRPTKLDWSKVKPAALKMARGQGRQTVARLKDQESQV